MSVDDALKMVISGGVVVPPWQKVDNAGAVIEVIEPIELDKTKTMIRRRPKNRIELNF